MTSTAPFLFLLFLIFLLNVSAEVQFTTHLSDSLDDPVFKKGAAFVFQFQAVTPESESKIRLFSPFPRITDIKLTNAYTLLQQHGHSDTLAGTHSVKMCNTADMEHLYDNLFNRLEEKFKILENEIQAAQTDQHNLVTMACSFLPPSIHPHEAPSRSKRAIGLIAAAARAAGLALGDPVKEAACSALSIFNLCTDTTELQHDIDGVLATRNQFQDVLQRVRTKNDENCFLLGHEIKDTQDSVAKITKLVGTQLKALEKELWEIKGVIANLPVCNQQLIHSMSFFQQIRDYIDHLGTLYAHNESYRAAFYAYQIAIFSTISSLAAGSVSPQFLVPSQLASIVNELAHDEILRGTKLPPATHVGQEAIYYEIQMVSEVSLLRKGISVVLCFPMNSKRPFNVYRAIPLYQPNDDGDTASLYHFPNPLLAISTDNSRFVELDVASLQQCSGNNRIKLCRQGFSTITGETLLCLPSFYYNYDTPALPNCKVESVLLPDAPQAFYLADGLYHIISRDPHIQMKNDSGSDFSISTLSCRACLIRPSCSSTLSVNQGDLELRPDLDFCKTKPEPFLTKIQLTPSLDQIFQHVPRTTSNFHTYSVTEALHSVLSSVRLELAKLPNVKTMSTESLAELTRPIAQYFSSVSPTTSAALSSYLPTRTAICFSVASITIFLFTFSISFTLFRPQWKRLFAHPQRFFRGTSGKFLHIVDAHPTSPDTDFSFLYLSVREFQALQALAHATLRDQTPPLVSTKPPASALPSHPPTNYSHPNPPLTSVYPTVTVPLYSESST